MGPQTAPRLSRFLFGPLAGALLWVSALTAAESRAAAARGDTPAARSAVDEFAGAVLQATGLLAERHVKKVGQADLVAWAVRELYYRLHTPIPKAIACRLTGAGLRTTTECKALLRDARRRLGTRKELEQWRDIDFALEGIFLRLEPDVEQIPQREIRQRPTCIDPAYLSAGVGLHLRKDPATGLVEVVTPVKDGPAYRAGIRAGEILLAITRPTGAAGRGRARTEAIRASDLSASAALQKISGEAGTKIKLTFRRPGKGPVQVQVTRRPVEDETVLGIRRRADDDWDFRADPGRRLAYVRLSRFSRETAHDLARGLAGLRRWGVKGLVLDLRSNPGGLLDSAVKVADLFIDDGVIMTVKPRRGEEAVYVGKHEGSYLDFPMACLVNDRTARTSEVVAASLQDHGRAVIVGQHSYGNTRLDTILPLDAGGWVWFASALMCRPSGRNLTKWMTAGRAEDEWGVMPDKGFAIELTPHERQALKRHCRDAARIWPAGRRVKRDTAPFRDRQLEAALAYLRKNTW